MIVGTKKNQLNNQKLHTMDLSFLEPLNKIKTEKQQSEEEIA
ncbi:MAG TPA: hypothetical protein VLA48_04640 [Nitrososphaeraceae archaeon]|nr:hypothetical protein [Nitrososphaeraceae archaeon]